MNFEEKLREVLDQIRLPDLGREEYQREIHSLLRRSFQARGTCFRPSHFFTHLPAPGMSSRDAYELRKDLRVYTPVVGAKRSPPEKNGIVSVGLDYDSQFTHISFNFGPHLSTGSLQVDRQDGFCFPGRRTAGPPGVTHLAGIW